MMDYGPDRKLVHAHSVGRSGYEDAVLRIHEPLLDILTHLSGKACMVVSYNDTPEFQHQSLADHLGIGPGAAEDNGRAQASAGELNDCLCVVQTSV